MDINCTGALIDKSEVPLPLVGLFDAWGWLVYWDGDVVGGGGRRRCLCAQLGLVRVSNVVSMGAESALFSPMTVEPLLFTAPANNPGSPEPPSTSVKDIHSLSYLLVKRLVPHWLFGRVTLVGTVGSRSVPKLKARVRNVRKVALGTRTL